MSRTDKDVPNWASCTYYEAVHRLRCRLSTPSYGGEECNLPAEPVRRHRSTDGRRYYFIRQCVWSATYDEYRPYRSGGCTKENRHFYWYGPDRAAVRDYCRKAVKDRELPHEKPEPVKQHRHASIKGWWD